MDGEAKKRNFRCDDNLYDAFVFVGDKANRKMAAHLRHVMEQEIKRYCDDNNCTQEDILNLARLGKKRK